MCDVKNANYTTLPLKWEKKKATILYSLYAQFYTVHTSLFEAKANPMVKTEQGQADDFNFCTLKPNLKRSRALFLITPKHPFPTTKL